MKSGDKLLVYINRFRQISGTFKYLGVEIDEEELSMSVLNGLPAFYGYFIVALDALGNKEGQFMF